MNEIDVLEAEYLRDRMLNFFRKNYADRKILSDRLRNLSKFTKNYGAIKIDIKRKISKLDDNKKSYILLNK